ncbi:MAG: bacterial transcriptional activator domain-containing protein [Thermoleophilia bacterium]
MRVGLGKAVELAAFLAAVGPAGATRDRIVAELFDGSDDGPNYLRQAVHRRRRPCRSRCGGGRLRWDPPGAVRTDDQELAALVARARLRLGDGRVQALRDAVAMCAGPYLPGLSGSATDARRREVAALDAEARAELARCLLEAGRPAEAAAAARDALGRDPLAEDAWQLLMRAEAAIGGPGAVGPLLRECRAALAAAGLEPCAATIRVADRLRRAGAASG